jgi:hypothetical protein
MNLPITACLLYTLQIRLTAICLWFEGQWWERLMKYIGIHDLLGLVAQSHNELKRLDNIYRIHFDYLPFYSKEKNHWLFEDPFHTCRECRKPKIRPSLKNIFLAKIGWGKYKNASFYLEGGIRG